MSVLEESIKNARILIVDDRNENIRLLDDILQLAGYRAPITTTDPTQVLLLYIEHQPDLILLDLHMVPLSGFAVMAQLRPVIPEEGYLPILVLTGDITLEARRRALSMGARDFVTKPYSSIEILLRIKNLLETRFLYLQQQNQNQILEQRVRERTQELDEARIEIIDRLALAAEYRDDETYQHTQRVGASSALLAQGLGLAEEQVELIRRAAPLHDVGKLGIPDAILRKPGKLTPEEFEVVKTHITIGARILSGSRFPLLQMAEELAYTHHERWDGTGYMGTHGENIPLVSRIVSVADVFDALVNRRPYKPAWPAEEAIAYIIDQRGRQFDPRVADIFVELQQRGSFALPLGEDGKGRPR